MHNGKKKLPRVNSYIVKQYFLTDTPSGPSKQFQRHAYQLVGNSSVTLIHYIGDSTAATPFPHGNSANATNYIRTCPSVLAKSKSYDGKTARNVYSELCSNTCTPELEAVCKPRNLSQVKNSAAASAKERRLTRDALYDVHEVAYELAPYVRVIRTYPDLLIIFAHSDIITELEASWQACKLSDDQCQSLLAYDTTFNIGDYYVSLLTAKHMLFSSEPVIPVAGIIHERKFTSVHTEFFQVVKTLIPSLSKLTLPIVTDREAAICDAIRSVCPNLKQVSCWRHLVGDVKRWVRASNGQTQDVRHYTDVVLELLRQPSVTAMEEVKPSSLAKCSRLFVDYFNTTLEQDIKDTAGRWVLEPLGIYNPYSGVTSNMAESMNAVLKRLMEWKEVPCNVVIEFLYNFQSYYANEVRRGICGMGQYQLKQQYAACRQESDMFTPLTFMDPATFIEQMRSGGTNSAVTHAPANGPEQTVHSSQPPRVTFAPGPVTEPPENFASMSRRARGRFYVNNNCLVLNPELHAFTVKTPSGINAVTLFPKEKCTCPATGACSHVLAARYAIGMEDTTKCKPTVNLTQLRRNTRKRPDKKSGRKQPRRLDVDVVPPPDAAGDENEKLDDSIALASRTKSHTIQQTDRPTEQCEADVSTPYADGSTVDANDTIEQPANCSMTTEEHMHNSGITVNTVQSETDKSIVQPETEKNIVQPKTEISLDNEAVKAWNADMNAVILSTSNLTCRTTSTVGSIKLSYADLKLLHPPHWLDDKVTSTILLKVYLFVPVMVIHCLNYCTVLNVCRGMLQVMDAYMELLQMESGRRFFRLPSTIVLKWERGLYKDWLFEKVRAVLRCTTSVCTELQ